MRGVKAATVAEYLKQLDPAPRATLQKLRTDIKAAVPTCEECISYGLPCVKLDGGVLVHYGAAAKHCAFYPGAHPVAALAEALAKYSVSKGTIRFPVDAPLPTTLVKKLMKARLTEYAAQARKRSGK
jgi:uncharacterized protein YdhG (YjbR/CyaY superfamily)